MKTFVNDEEISSVHWASLFPAENAAALLWGMWVLGAKLMKGDLWKMVIEIHRKLVPPPKVEVEADIIQLASYFTSTLHPNDMCFHFPSGERLYASSKFLAPRCEYFRDLLRSGLRDATLGQPCLGDGVPFKRNRFKSDPNSDTETEEWDDDDDEEQEEQEMDVATVEFAMVDDGTQLQVERECHVLVHHYKENWTSIKTFRAVLCYLYTSSITFAPLRSSILFPPPTPSSTEPRPLPSNPLFASPKSVYRLAHFWRLGSLQNLALEEFKSQLTVLNVAWELDSDPSERFDKIREACLDFAAKNWDKVKGGAAMNKLEQEWDHHKRKEYPKIAPELAKRL